MLTHPNTIQWLYALWKMRRAQSGMFFSQRRAFFDALRPRVCDGAQSVLVWPNAILFVRPADVDRATEVARQLPWPD